jgi:hypothetical protein
MEHILSHGSIFFNATTVIVGCTDTVTQRCVKPPRLDNEFDHLYDIDLGHDRVWFIGMALVDDFFFLMTFDDLDLH